VYLNTVHSTLCCNCGCWRICVWVCFK